MAEDISGYGSVKNWHILYIIFVVILFAGLLFLIKYIEPVTFAVYDTEKTDYYLENLGEAAAKYNGEADRLPAIFRSVFGNERLNVTLIRMNGERVNLAVETYKGKIKSMVTGEMKNPTMQLEIKESILKKMSESDNAIDELNKAFNNKEIKYSTVRSRTRVKMALIKTTATVWSWFS